MSKVCVLPTWRGSTIVVPQRLAQFYSKNELICFKLILMETFRDTSVLTFELGN